MKSPNRVALALYGLGVIAICTALWVVLIDRDEAPGATGSVSGATSGSITPVTPETPGR